MSKALYETVPQSLSGQFGVLTNLYICFAILLATIVGVMLPTDPVYYSEDKMWRVIFAFPIFFAVIQMALLLVYFKEEPVSYCIALKKDKQAIRFIKKIYSTPASLKGDDLTKVYTDFIEI
jgi:hypothetical protein